MDPDTSKIQLIARLVQMYKQKDTLAPSILIAEWNKFLTDLQKEQGTWDEAFRKTNVSPDVADRIRIEVTEKVNELIDQGAKSQLPKQVVQQETTQKKEDSTESLQKQAPAPPLQKSEPPKSEKRSEEIDTENLIGAMFSETMKKVKLSPDVPITDDLLKEFKLPSIVSQKQVEPPKKQQMQPIIPQKDVNISDDLKNLDSILNSQNIPTKKTERTQRMQELMPPQKDPIAMKFTHDHSKDDHIIVESHDQQHAILSNLNSTIDKYWPDITEVAISHGIPKQILTKFDWIYEKNELGNVVLTTDSFGNVTVDEKAYAKEVSNIIDEFIKKENEFTLIKKIAAHKAEPHPITEKLQQKATEHLSRLESMTNSQDKNEKLFSNVMGVMDKVYSVEQKKEDTPMQQKDIEFLEQIGLSHTHMTTLSSSLFEMARRENLGHLFNFKSPSDPNAKELAKWIYDRIPKLISKQIDETMRKKLATRLFIKIWEIIK